MNYKLKENANGDSVLFINEKEAFCPYAQPIKVANNLGGFGIMRLPCQSGCPHFECFEKDGESGYADVTVSCSANKKTFVAEIETIEKPAKPAMIIS